MVKNVNYFFLHYSLSTRCFSEYWFVQTQINRDKHLMQTNKQGGLSTSPAVNHIASDIIYGTNPKKECFTKRYFKTKVLNRGDIKISAVYANV